MDIDPVISARGLTKTFGRTAALRGLDLNVEAGTVHGFLGPNGAGKSTTIRILLGLLRADDGTATLWGHDVWRDALTLSPRVSYVPSDVVLWPNLTGGEAIDVFARLRGGFDVRRRDALVERFDLDPSKRCGTYSKGNRQKVAIIAALAAAADLVVMDEPSSGLDPLMEVVFRDCVREERDRGHTVLLSSHTLAQVEQLCDVVSIIREGRIIESGSLDDLRHLTRTTVHVTTRRPLMGLADQPGVHDVQFDGDQAMFSVEADALDAVIGMLHGSGITSLTCQPPSLEDLFLRHYATDRSAVTA